MIAINPSDLIILGSFSALGIISTIALFLVFKFTPAKTFLMAWLHGNPIGYVSHRHGIGEFIEGKIKDKGFIDFKHVGPVMMTENSHSFEQKSKRPIFNVFSEFASSIPKEFYAFVTELRSLGFPVRNSDQYKALVNFISRGKYDEVLDKLEISEEKRKKLIVQMTKIRDEGISIEPWKTYNIKELADLFPNNINPSFITLKVDNAVNRQRKADKFRQQMLITGAIAFFIVVIGGVIALKFIGATNPEVTVQLAQGGVQAINQTVQNATSAGIPGVTM